MAADKVMHLIGSEVLNAHNITIGQVRAMAVKQDLGLHNQLQRGRAILQHEAHLDQYLWSYGKMVDAQWSVVQHIALACCDDVLAPITGCFSTQVYDYGCGQGLSTLGILHTLERMGQYKGPSWDVQHILHMDPSKVALQRAAAIAQCKAPQAQLHSQHAYVPQMGNLLGQQNVLHVHVFSNSMDIQGFRYQIMVQSALGMPGVHMFFVVSSDRACYGGTAQLQHTHRLVTENSDSGAAKRVMWDSGMQYFGCNGSMNAVAFISLVEVQ